MREARQQREETRATEGRPPREDFSDRDVFSKSEKWLPQPPTPDCSKWVNRESEIEGCYTYVQSLRSWSMLASDRLANEISQAISYPGEIVTSHLTAGQQARSSRLFAILRSAFSNYPPRIDSLIRAFEAGAPIHNSPMKPFGSCGFELLRVLALEFAFKTRTEAVCLRSEVLKKTFRVDVNSPSQISDLLRSMAVETFRYDKLISTLPQTIPRDDLRLTESDQALIFVRSLPDAARQFVLLHAADDGLASLREAGLRYETQQRLYSELGTIGGKLRSLGNDDEYPLDEPYDDWFWDDEVGDWVNALHPKCRKCGKKHETYACTTDMSKVKCFRCGKMGHIGASWCQERRCKDVAV